MKSSGAVSLAAVAWFALVLGGAACRRYTPPPPDASPIATGGTPMPGTGGGTGGSPGTGGSKPDLAPPMDEPPPEPKCGEGGKPCCPGNHCGGGGCCENGVCTPHGTGCKLADSASCYLGRCSNICGGTYIAGPMGSMRCCANRNCTLSYHTCVGDGIGSCVKCGGKGEPCCSDNWCADGMCMGGRCGMPPDASPDTPADLAGDRPPG